MLYTIWDVYNHLKKQRDVTLEILKVNAEEPDGGSLREEELDCLEAETMFLTNTLAAIDRGQGRPTEADERG